MRTCERCGSPLVRRPRENRAQWESRRFCSQQCGWTSAFEGTRERHRRAHAQARAELIEEVEELLGRGMSPQQVVSDLGTNLRAITRRLFRSGRQDLAQVFERAERAEQRAAREADSTF